MSFTSFDNQRMTKRFYEVHKGILQIYTKGMVQENIFIGSILTSKCEKMTTLKGQLISVESFKFKLIC